MNTFEKLVGNNGNEVLKRRAGNLASQAALSQNNLINTLEARKTDLESKLINLTDLAPTSKDSLSPGVQDFNANQWVQELQSLKTELYDVQISINIAKETYTEFFTDKSSKAEESDKA